MASESTRRKQRPSAIVPPGALPALSVLVSQLGYRPEDVKKGYLRADTPVADVPETFSVVEVASGAVVLAGQVRSCGEKWGVSFWELNFSEVREPGTYALHFPNIGTRSDPFTVAHDLFVDQTLIKTSVDNLEPRAKGKLGWQDCGFDGRGVESHTVLLLGLADAFDAFQPILSPENRARFLQQLHHGATYLLACQRDDGSLMNEYYIARDKCSWTLTALAAVALARVQQIDDAVAFLEAAKRCWDWCTAHVEYGEMQRADELEDTRKIYGQYAPWQPPSALRARDELLLIWAGTELYKNTNDLKYKRVAIHYAAHVCDYLQHLDYTAFDDGTYGNFYAWEGSGIFQRSWEHAGWGYNCGAVLADEMNGLLNLCTMFPEAEDWPKWRYAVRQYAYGYVKRVTALNPFSIYPLGMCEGDVMFFGPAWHGFNGVYGRVARTCMKLAQLYGDASFETIALSNLQWIAGLNVGIKAADGQYHGFSWIAGIGEHAVQAWTGISGAISSGFCANPQFRLRHLDDLEDRPAYLTTEDWILYNGAWLSGMAEISKSSVLRVKTQYRGKPVRAQVLVQLPPESFGGETNHRGVFVRHDLPRLRAGTINVTWNGHTIEEPLQSISGALHLYVIDFADALTANMEVQDGTGSVQFCNRGTDDVQVQTDLLCVGVSISPRQFSAVLPSGEKHSFAYTYMVDTASPRPAWIMAQIRSPYSYIVREIDWTPSTSGEHGDPAVVMRDAAE